MIDYIKQYFVNSKKKMLTVLVSTLLFGIIAHGSAMFNNYAFFDNADLFNIGSTFELGRWFLGLMGWLTMYISGSLLYTTPLFNSLITILSISVISFILIDLFKIEKQLPIILFCGVMVVFPAVTSALGYMFTAPYYYFGLLIGVLGIFFYYKKRTWYTFLFAILLLACGAGTYQPNMSFYIVILLLLVAKEVYYEKYDYKKFIKLAIITCLLCICMLIVYLLINNLSLKLVSVEMSSYKDANSVFDMGLQEYLRRISYAYKEFFSPVDNSPRNMYPFSLNKFYRILLIILIVAVAIKIIHIWKDSLQTAIITCFLMILFPLANNFFYIMCDIDLVYSIMMYGEVGIFILAILLLDNISNNEKVLKYVKYCICVLLVVFNILYVKFDNDCYLKADIQQNQIKSYITTLVTQIKSLDGYKDGMKICFIGEGQKQDLSISEVENLEYIKIYPFHLDTLLHDYNFRRIMQRQIGFYPERVESSEMENIPEVVNMSCYPNSGSIKIINDTVVVKFSNN